MKKSDRLLWTNHHPDLSSLVKQIEREGKELNQKEKEALVNELNHEVLRQLRDKLDIYLNRPILLIGSFGMWDGTRRGLKDIGSSNIKDCFYSNCDYVTWYLDEKGDLRCDALHDEGKNHYLYRFWKDDVTDRQQKLLWEKHAAGKDISYETRLFTKSVGREIARVYGWKSGNKNRKDKVRV